jgi:arylsulfatase A-like enzyme
MHNTSTKPNIIYILSDQHRYAAMSHAGDPNVQTPFMDRLAAEGVSFDRAYANCPICVPSRGTIFTGRHAHANGVVSNFSTLYADLVALLDGKCQVRAQATATMTYSLLGLYTCRAYQDRMWDEFHAAILAGQVPDLRFI